MNVSLRMSETFSVSSLITISLRFAVSFSQTLGNHEFDMGPPPLVTFLRALNFSVVSSNIDVSSEPKWPQREKLFNKSMVFNIGGEKIGVVGYVTKETKWLVLSFLPYEIAKLRSLIVCQ